MVILGSLAFPYKLKGIEPDAVAPVDVEHLAAIEGVLAFSAPGASDPPVL